MRMSRIKGLKLFSYLEKSYNYYAHRKKIIDLDFVLAFGVILISYSILFMLIARCQFSFITAPEIRQPEQMESLKTRNLLKWPVMTSSWDNLKFMVIIHTQTLDFKRRSEWRSTYGTLKLKYNFEMIFSIGRPLLSSQQDDIELIEEYRKYGDLLQGDYIDTYKNLTLKQLTQLRYFNRNLSTVPILLKIDDDIVWNVDIFSHMVDNIINNSSEHDVGYDILKPLDLQYGTRLWCNVWTGASVQRYRDDKWAVSRSTVPDSTWPDYCSGAFYVATQEAIAGVLKATDDSQYLWIDDIFITGVLTLKASVELVDISDVVEISTTHRDESFENGKIIFSNSLRSNTLTMFKSVN